MSIKRCHIYLEDESPRIGAGWRVGIASIGYRWVRLKVPGAERGAKIKREVWNKLRKDEQYAKTD